MSDARSRSESNEPRWTDWLRIAIPVIVVTALIVTAWRFGYFDLKHQGKLDQAAQRAEGTPWLAPIFVIVYATIAALAAPVSPLAYGAGAIFGLVRGSVYVWTGSMLGAAAGYVLARGVWANTAQRLLSRYRDKISAMRHGNVFFATLRVQAMPMVPFGIFNYAAGAGRFSFPQFLGGTALGIMPGTVAAVYVGDRIVTGIVSDRHALAVGAAVMAALLLLSFVPAILKKIRS